MKLVLFDVDGTLIDSQNIIVASITKAYESVGIEPPTREKALSIVGLSLPAAMEALVGCDGPISEMVEGYKNAIIGYRSSQEIVSPFFEGAKELVERLSSRDDVMIGLATGKARRGVNHILEKNGWQNFFATIQTADSAPSKPNPDMILQAMQETGASPSDVVMIGDTTYDIEMGCNAGVNTIGVSWGYHPTSELIETGAQVIVDTCHDLGQVIDGFIATGQMSK
ncbi:HAD-IA family hydrolase [Microvirga sp. W0021]|uniref:HAD-IA family hydrolase n=1 Tax=Hohaiivirga grylli TaxID=3133970 RepID=A0ABV0BK78_9HYPH